MRTQGEAGSTRRREGGRACSSAARSVHHASAGEEEEVVDEEDPASSRRGKAVRAAARLCSPGLRALDLTPKRVASRSMVAMIDWAVGEAWSPSAAMKLRVAAM